MDKLVIFDCDGVLVDSEIIANRMDAEAFTSLGYHISTEESIRKFTGLNVKTVHQIILEESGKNIPVDFLISLQPKILKAFETELCPLIKPILETLEDMQISRCVASSSSKDRVIRSLELTHQLTFFTHPSIFTSQQVAKGKPAPDLFLFAASQMGFSPEDCIVIEDSTAGIEAALSAGMHVIGFLGGSHAHYNWYEARINKYNVPTAKNCNELLFLLKNLIGDFSIAQEINY